MTRNEIYKFYENKIDDLRNEDFKRELGDKLEEIDTLLFELDMDIEKELENEEAEYLPSYAEYWEDFENSRKAMML